VFAWEDDRVLKLFHEGMSGMAERELEATRIAHEASLPVPAPDGIVEVDHRSGIVLERVDGPSLEEWMLSRPWRVFAGARTLARLHAEMHAVEAAGLPSLHEVIEGKIRRDEGWPAPVREATLKAVSQLPEGNAICHWDFHAGNIVMAVLGPRIIDWSEAVLSNPLADVAMTWLLTRVSALPPWARMQRLVLLVRRWFYLAYQRHYRELRPFRDEDLSAWKIPVLAVHITRRIPDDRSRMLALLEGLLRHHGYL